MNEIYFIKWESKIHDHNQNCQKLSNNCPNNGHIISLGVFS